jgi:hypothetical protein
MTEQQKPETPDAEAKPAAPGGTWAQNCAGAQAHPDFKS